jgi:hypothetical protein
MVFQKSSDCVKHRLMIWNIDSSGIRGLNRLYLQCQLTKAHVFHHVKVEINNHEGLFTYHCDWVRKCSLI